MTLLATHGQGTTLLRLAFVPLARRMRIPAHRWWILVLAGLLAAALVGLAVQGLAAAVFALPLLASPGREHEMLLGLVVAAVLVPGPYALSACSAREGTSNVLRLLGAHRRAIGYSLTARVVWVVTMAMLVLLPGLVELYRDTGPSSGPEATAFVALAFLIGLDIAFAVNFLAQVLVRRAVRPLGVAVVSTALTVVSVWVLAQVLTSGLQFLPDDRTGRLVLTALAAIAGAAFVDRVAVERYCDPRVDIATRDGGGLASTLVRRRTVAQLVRVARAPRTTEFAAFGVLALVTLFALTTTAGAALQDLVLANYILTCGFLAIAYTWLAHLVVSRSYESVEWRADGAPTRDRLSFLAAVSATTSTVITVVMAFVGDLGLTTGNLVSVFATSFTVGFCGAWASAWWYPTGSVREPADGSMHVVVGITYLTVLYGLDHLARSTGTPPALMYVMVATSVCLATVVAAVLAPFPRSTR